MSVLEYSIIVPIFNDGSLARDFCIELETSFKEALKLPTLSDVLELIFVNDGSSNDSQTHLENLRNEFNFVRVIELSRNFGQHIALTCGYEKAKGKYVASLNVDLEDPPKYILTLIEYLKKNNHDIVTSLRTNRKPEFLRDLLSKSFHSILNTLTGFQLPTNCSTLRVMTRQFIDAYCKLNESSRYLPGLESWLGFSHGYLPTEQRPRSAGKSSYTLKRRLRMAFTSIISFSDMPLRLCVYFGLFVAFTGFLLASLLIIEKLFFVNLRPGYTSTIAVIVFFSGMQMAVLGVVGLYVGRILREVQQRPVYLVKSDFEQKRTYVQLHGT